MRQKLSQAIPIKDLLMKIFTDKSGSTDKKVLVYDLQDHWEQLVGEPLHRYSQPVEFNGNRLIIGVRGSSWANEFQLRQTSILKKIKETLPHITVNEIQFRIL